MYNKEVKMKYETVVEEMIEGKKAKLPEWTGYLYMDNKGRILHKCGKINIPARDYLRMDWEIVEEKKSLSDKIITADGLHHEVKVCIEEDVKEKLKEFLDYFNKLYPTGNVENIKQKAKELFGERLI